MKAELQTTRLARLMRRLRNLGRRSAHEVELDEEIRFHLAMEAAELERRGFSRTEAARSARIAFGGAQQTKEAWRDGRLGASLGQLSRDMRVAVRRLVAHPSFSVPVILTLGVGLGAVAAIFALANAVILRPLPYPNPDRLVAVGHLRPNAGLGGGGMSEAELTYYQSHSRTLESVTGFYSRELSLTGGPAPERVTAALVTPNFFPVLGVAPQRGRGCSGTDFAGWDLGTSTRVVVISHALWLRRFGGDTSVVGRTVDEVNRLKMLVAGVMPEGFHFPNIETHIWFCWPVDTLATDLGDRAYTGIARLRAGTTLEEAGAELRAFDPVLATRFGTSANVDPATPRANVQPLGQLVVRDVRSALVLLLAAAALVLLVAWANVANLFIARAEKGHQLAAIERALGAGEVDILRRTVVEGILVASLGGVLAVAIAVAAIDARFGLRSDQIPRLHEVRFDGLLILLIAALASVTGATLGAVAYVRTRHARSARAATSLTQTSRTTASRQWRRTAHGLVAVQLALALALVVGSVALVESYVNLSRASLGFDPSNTLIVDLSLPFSPYPRYADGARFYAEVTDRIRRVPGVGAVEVAGGNLPLAPQPLSDLWTVTPADAPTGPRSTLPVHFAAVTPGWFSALHIPIVRGRSFQAGDLVGPAPVVLSQSLARVLYGDADPIGRRVRVRGLRYEEQVIGVVGDVPGASVADGSAPTIYFPILDDLRSTPEVKPLTPLYAASNSIFIRANGVGPMTLLATVQRIVHDIDPQVPVARPRVFADVVSNSTARARLMMILLLIAAGAALLLGAVGIYGVTAYVVGGRTRELGIRMALGATADGVRAMIVRQHVGAIIAGIIGGLCVAAVMTRLLRDLLYQVGVVEPLIFAVSAAGVFLLGILGSWLPARRAAKVDIVRTLRSE